MSQFSRTFTVALLTASLFTSGIAEAKRVGGGRSSGMQRSQTTRPAAPPPQRNVAPAQQPATPQPQPQRSGMGAILGGVAAGALGGYLLGNMFNSNHASGTSESSGGGFPWGLLLLLGAGGYFAMRMMRKRKEAASPAFAGIPNHAAPPADNTQNRIFRMGEQQAAAPAAAGITRLPDGTETAAFLRQARASFMHMQTLHTAEQVNEMRKYLTPELFNELSKEISGNEEPAEFPELNTELVDCATEEGRMVSSVRFYGKVSESLHAAPEPFQEIWHFVRPINGDPRWMVAGIQQL